jgi:threo-3-hydroxy-L-aspartate ammonia-lyase
VSVGLSPRLSVSLADVQAAALRIRDHVHRTPVLTSRRINQQMGAELFFKCEMFQRTCAFKVRGAFSRMTLLSADQLRRGVVAFSSGNHAQAVALAARELGTTATIVMPRDAPALKIAATRGYGARVVFYDRPGESREEIAGRIVAEEGALLVPPFDDDAVIAGQGTLALELLEDAGLLDVLVSPCGGGGLLSGIAVAASGICPGIRIHGVEPEAGDDMKRSLEKGEPVSISVPQTIADALQTTRPAKRTLAIVAALTEGIVTVSDTELRRGMAYLASTMKIVVEPGGAAAFAALLAGRVPAVAGRRIGVVLSGGNVDPESFGRFVMGLQQPAS